MKEKIIRTQLKSKYFPPTVDPSDIDWNAFEKRYDEVQYLMKKKHLWFENGHNYNFRSAEHKKIILGRGQFYIQFADFMYEKYNVRYYLLDFMNRVDDINAYDQLLFYILDAEEIHINLEGVSKRILKKATSKSPGLVARKEDIGSIHTTAWEINQIFHRPDLLEKTFFHTGSSMSVRKAYKILDKRVPLDRILDDNRDLEKNFLKEHKDKKMSEDVYYLETI